MLSIVDAPPAAAEDHLMSGDTARLSRIFVVGQFVLIAIFAGAVFFDPGAPDIVLPDAFSILGFALCAAGIVIGTAALAAMGRVMQVSPQPKADGHLVTGGVYRYMRHPMYTAIVLIVIGLWLRRPALLISIAGIALIVWLVRKARFEEALLESRYPEYRGYRSRTWGVIPWTGRAQGDR